MVDEIDNVLTEILIISDRLYENNIDEISNKVDEIFRIINKLMLKFIEKSPEYNGMGISVPTEVLLEQVRNLMEAYREKDIIMLADTMKYEIYNALQFYRDILAEVGDIECE